jgi:hypothetical protein
MKVLKALFILSILSTAYATDALAEKKWVTKSDKWCIDHGFSKGCQVFELTVKPTKAEPTETELQIRGIELPASK